MSDHPEFERILAGSLEEFRKRLSATVGVADVSFIPSQGAGDITLEVSGKVIGSLRIIPAPKDSLVLDLLVENLSKTLEAKLLEVEKEFLLRVLDNINEGIVACDEQGTLKLFNKKTREFHGIPEEAIPPEKWADHYDIYYAGGKEPMQFKDIPLFRAFEGETVEDLPMVIARKGRAPLNILSNGCPIFDDTGKKIGAVVTMRDETELKLELDKFELRFRTIFEQSPLSIQICTTDGRTRLVNPAWKKLWGIPEEVINNFILKDYNMLEDPVLRAQGVLSYIQDGFAGKVTKVPVIPYDPSAAGLAGTRKYVEGLFFPLKDDSGVVKEIVLIHLDVTETKKLSEHSHFLEKLTAILITSLDYDVILSQIAEACVGQLADGCILDVVENEKIHRQAMKHKDPGKQILMEELQRSFPPTMNSPQPTARVIRSGEPELLRVVDPKVIASRSYDENHAALILRIGIRSHLAVPIKVRDQIIGSISLLVTSDREVFSDLDLQTAVEVGRRAGLAIENSRLYRNAQEALKQREEFISVASHELKTPITSMKLHLQLANMALNRNTSDKIDAAYFRKVTDVSTRQLDKITTLVEDMLDISRITSGKLALNVQEENVGLLVQEVLERLRAELPNLSPLLSVNIPDDVIAFCDGFRIEQVITNLVTNAYKYGNSTPVTVQLQTRGDFVELIIADRGPGIALADQERIFERFERAVPSSNISGLGLGLFICRQILGQHGGSLELRSSSGEGATFIARFKAGRNPQ